MQHWFVTITSHIKLSGLFTGILIFVFVTVLFAIPLGVFSFRFAELDYRNSVGVALFFGGLTAYALVIGSWVIHRSEEEFDSWSQQLTCAASELAASRKSLSYASRRYAFIVILVALLLATIHVLLIYNGLDELWEDLKTPTASPGIIGTYLMWLLVMSVISAFIRNANTYTWLIENHLPIKLFTSDYRSINRLASLPALCMAGIQILFPLLSLDAIFDGDAVLPGVAITLSVTCYVFFRPVLAIRKRIRQEKEALLERLDDEIAGRQHSEDVIENLGQLQAALVGKMYLERIADWPINLSGFARWFVFIVIPPATWVGAALIENVVDGLL